jgi:hypothetical protein
VLLDFLDDVFLLHFALEASEGAFNRLVVGNLDLGQSLHLLPWLDLGSGQ